MCHVCVVSSFLLSMLSLLLSLCCVALRRDVLWVVTSRSWEMCALHFCPCCCCRCGCCCVCSLRLPEMRQVGRQALRAWRGGGLQDSTGSAKWAWAKMMLQLCARCLQSQWASCCSMFPNTKASHNWNTFVVWRRYGCPDRALALSLVRTRFARACACLQPCHVLEFLLAVPRCVCMCARWGVRQP